MQTQAEPAGGSASSFQVTLLLCAAQVLSMTGFAAYPTLLPDLRDGWNLSNSEAGLISSMFFAGYMAAVPVLASLTDRIDVRRVYTFSCGLSAAGCFGFALLAQGLWSAALLQALCGAGMAGTYMPGLKALTDRVHGRRQGRAVAFYTSTFGLGASVSLLLAGFFDSIGGWAGVFLLAGVGPVLAAILVYQRLPAAPHGHASAHHQLLDLRPVLENRGALSYIAGYAVHCWELFGLRSWLVAFLAFSIALKSGSAVPKWEPASMAAVINLLGPAASIIGNELALRFRRRRVVLAVIAASGVLACGVGFSAPLPWLAVFVLVTLYYVLIMADSAALTAGVVAVTPVPQRGTTMAVHSFFGFGAGFLAPLVFGVVLDAGGGSASLPGWGLAFASLGLPSLVGAGLVIYGERKRRRLGAFGSRLNDLD